MAVAVSHEQKQAFARLLLHLREYLLPENVKNILFTLYNEGKVTRRESANTSAIDLFDIMQSKCLLSENKVDILRRLLDQLYLPSVNSKIEEYASQYLSGKRSYLYNMFCSPADSTSSRPLHRPLSCGDRTVVNKTTPVNKTTIKH